MSDREIVLQYEVGLAHEQPHYVLVDVLLDEQVEGHQYEGEVGALDPESEVKLHSFKRSSLAPNVDERK